MIPLGDSRRRRRVPWWTWSLAASLAAVWAWELSLGSAGGETLARIAISPAEIAAFADPVRIPLRIVASLFLHASWIHLLGNVAFLVVFGDDVEARIGPRRFLLVYFGSGLFATAAQTAATPGSELPLVGASGAIAGLLGCFLVLFPGARLRGVLPLGCLLLPMRSRADLFLPGWFLLQIAGALLAAPGSPAARVAWVAHLAGFAAGPLLLIPGRGRRR